METNLRPVPAAFTRAANQYPFPIASVCQRYLDLGDPDPWVRWGFLSGEVLQRILHYLSHLLLADLAASQTKRPELLHHIEGILGRPLTGQYVGFLRETARSFHVHSIPSAFPKLVDFIYRSEVEASLLPDRKPLLGLLNEYRRLWAHGRIDNASIIRRNLEVILNLCNHLLDELRFLEEAVLELEDGKPLMGAFSRPTQKNHQDSSLRIRQGQTLRPLLLKMGKGEVSLLEQVDFDRLRVVYKSDNERAVLKKKDFRKEAPQRLLNELRDLYERVRSTQAVVERLNWQSFFERAGLITDRVLHQYDQSGKYRGADFIPRPIWEGEDSRFQEFLRSDKSLLAIDGVQGSGKSALLAHLATQLRTEGKHSVLFLNAQHFSAIKVMHDSENPLPAFFAGLLRSRTSLDSPKQILSKSSDPSGKVVLFVDSINELDALGTRWNRFRAMDRLLEWIVAMSHPSVKIVLGFRLEAYRQYGFLASEDLPNGLIAQAWTHDAKPGQWVQQLEPFNADQAKRLFEHFQSATTSGMAPLFSWADLQSSLDEQLESFTSNPLLFRIFLRAHHAHGMILETDPDKLFDRYANLLTGAADRNQQTMLQAAVQFLKNGNLTRKEILLSKIAQKVAQYGGTSVRVDTLNPKDKKHGGPILEALADPETSGLNDLIEGEIISMEASEITLPQTAQPTSSPAPAPQGILQSISIVSELLSECLTTISLRNERIYQFRSYTLLFIFLAAIVSIMAAMLFTPILTKVQSQVENIDSAIGIHQEVFNINPGLQHLAFRAKDMANSSFYQSALQSGYSAVMALIICYFFVLLISFQNLNATSAKALGVTQYAYLKHYDLRLTNKMWQLWAALAVLPIGWLVFQGLQHPRQFSHMDISIVAPLIGLIFVMFSSTMPMIQERLAPIPQGERNIALKAFSAQLTESEKLWRASFSLVKLKTSILFLSILILFSWVFITFFPEPKALISQSSFDWASFRMSLEASIHNSTLAQSAIVGVIFPAVFLGYVFLSHFQALAVAAQSRRRVNRLRNGLARHRSGFGQVLLIGFELTLIPVPVVLLLERLPQEAIQHLDRNQLVATYGIEAFGDLPHRASLSQAMEPELLRSVLSNPSLKALTLESGVRLPKEATLPPNLKFLELEAPLHSLNDRVKLPKSLVELVIHNPRDIFQSKILSAPNLRRLEIIGECKSLASLPASFPLLQILSIDETPAKDALYTLPSEIGLDPMIEVTSEGPPKLDWLTDSAADQYLFRLLNAPSAQTENLDKLVRVFLPVDELDPNTLRSLTSAQWIHLESYRTPGTDSPKVPVGFIQPMAKALLQLPRLANFEISSGLPLPRSQRKDAPDRQNIAFGRYNILNRMFGPENPNVWLYDRQRVLSMLSEWASDNP